MMIGKLELLSAEKLSRAQINLGEKAKPEALVAEYDRLGGLIKQHDKTGAKKVKAGCFWDFEKNCVIKKPKIELV